MALQQPLAAPVIRVSVVSSREDDVGVDEEAQRPKPSPSMSSSSAACRPLVERPRLTKPSFRSTGKRSARTWPASTSGATPRSAAAAVDTTGNAVDNFDRELRHASSLGTRSAVALLGGDDLTTRPARFDSEATASRLRERADYGSEPTACPCQVNVPTRGRARMGWRRRSTSAIDLAVAPGR